MSRERGDLARAFLLVAALHLVGLGAPYLLEPDEGRYADVARSALEGSWVVPRVNGVAFVDKPPLVIWLAALSMRALGPSALALRLVPALFGIGAAAVAAWLARETYGRGAALAAIAYATCPLALGVGRVLVLDVPLAATTALGLGLVAKGAGLFRSPRSLAASALGGAVLGLATIVKGPVAIGLAGLPFVLLVFLVFARRSEAEPRLALLARLASPLPWVVAVLVAAPWFLLASRVEPGFLEAFFLGENWKRFAARSVEHTHGPFFFLGVLAWGLGPWLLAGIALVLARIRSPREKNDDASEPRGRGFLLGFAALTVIFFSLSSTKVETYLLPAFPALAAVIAGETARALEGGDDRERRALAVAFGAVAACFVLASLAGLLVGLHAFELTAARWKAFQEETVPWLALLPLPFVFLACLHARARKPLRAVLVLALALLSAFPFAIGPARAATRLRSCEPIALLIQEARSERAPGARVASFHYYYRGLPFYLDEPVVLLGEKGELHDDAFLDRPDLYFDDTRIVTFMRGSRPVLVAMPNEKERPARFLQFFEQAGAVPTLVGVVDDDVLFLVP